MQLWSSFNMSSSAESGARRVQMQSQHRLQSGRHRLVLLAIGFAAASLASIYTLGPTLSSVNDHPVIDSHSSQRRLQTALGMYIDPKSVDIKQISEELYNPSNNNVVTSDANTNPTITTYSHLIHNDIALPKYTLEQVIQETPTMRSKYAILRYDPHTDKFTGYYSKYERWVPGCYKLMHSLSALTVLLRTIFPERFTKNSPEFIMGVSSGDYPAMADQECIYRDQDVPCDGGGVDKAPVLHFGSVFRKAMFPNMVGECLFVCLIIHL